MVDWYNLDYKVTKQAHIFCEKNHFTLDAMNTVHYIYYVHFIQV